LPGIPAASVVRAVGRRAPLSVRRAWRTRKLGLSPRSRIFGIGLSRTGTTSLDAALETLSYRTIHFPADPVTQAEMMAFLTDGGPSLRLSVLDWRDAMTDTPAAATFEGLDVAYPGSRFILTVRDKESWLESCAAYWPSRAEPYLAEHQDSEGEYISAVFLKLFGSVGFNRDAFARGYDDYHDRVRSYFARRPSDLLTIDVSAGDGWGPLCAFLGRPVPGRPFPRTNVGAETKL
jgi:hypothetical protein